MILQFTPTIETAIEIEQSHIIISLKLAISFFFVIEILLIKEQDRVNRINVRQTSTSFAITVNRFHFLVQILKHGTFIINFLIICRILCFENICNKSFCNFHMIVSY